MHIQKQSRAEFQSLRHNEAGYPLHKGLTFFLSNIQLWKAGCLLWNISELGEKLNSNSSSGSSLF